MDFAINSKGRWAIVPLVDKASRSGVPSLKMTLQSRLGAQALGADAPHPEHVLSIIVAPRTFVFNREIRELAKRSQSEPSPK